jgi:hypothetical protein
MRCNVQKLETASITSRMCCDYTRTTLIQQNLREIVTCGSVTTYGYIYHWFRAQIQFVANKIQCL